MSLSDTLIQVKDGQVRPLFSPKSLAAYLNVCERTARQLLADGKIASYKIEGQRRVDPADVERYLKARKDGR